MHSIRPEAARDVEAVAAVLDDAFPTRAEADLVVRLRDTNSAVISLVAESSCDGGVVGHAMFSPVQVDGSRIRAGGLGPLGVLPHCQRRGVGSALVREGLKRSRELAWAAVFVLGDPAYYSRFGFELAAAHGLHYSSHAYDGAFQVIELQANALREARGWVRYARPFDDV